MPFFTLQCMRSVIDYAVPVFHHALPAYLSQELERVQKRTMRIISPGIEYQYALAPMSLPTVAMETFLWKLSDGVILLSI